MNKSKASYANAMIKYKVQKLQSEFIKSPNGLLKVNF